MTGPHSAVYYRPQRKVHSFHSSSLHYEWTSLSAICQAWSQLTVWSDLITMTCLLKDLSLLRQKESGCGYQWFSYYYRMNAITSKLRHCWFVQISKVLDKTDVSPPLFRVLTFTLTFFLTLTISLTFSLSLSYVCFVSLHSLFTSVSLLLIVSFDYGLHSV